jgi:hypothetical protein
MAGLDGELSSQEQAELDRLLADDDRLQAEWERFRRVKEVTETMSYREPPPEIWEDYWTVVYNRLERGLGWILVSVAALVLFGYGAWHAIEAILADSGLPGFVKIAIFALVLGAAILFVSVAREKLFTRKRDAYSEIQR